MNQKFHYRNYDLVIIFFIILVLLFVIEFVFLTPLIASLTVVPLLGVLFFLKSDYLYTIDNNCLNIYVNGNKRITLHIEEIKSVIKTNYVFKNSKVILISKDNQEFNLYIKKEEVDKFISNFQIK